MILLLRENSFDSAGAVAPAQAMPHLHSIETFDIAENAIGASWTSLGSSLSGLVRLRLLGVNSTQMGETGTIALAASLSQFLRLERLILCNNRIGDAGTAAVSDAVSHWPIFAGCSLLILALAMQAANL